MSEAWPTGAAAVQRSDSRRARFLLQREKKKHLMCWKCWLIPKNYHLTFKKKTSEEENETWEERRKRLGLNNEACNSTCSLWTLVSDFRDSTAAASTAKTNNHTHTQISWKYNETGVLFRETIPDVLLIIVCAAVLHRRLIKQGAEQLRRPCAVGIFIVFYDLSSGEQGDFTFYSLFLCLHY